MKKLLAYVMAVLAIGVLLETTSRHFQPLFRAASHRGLFKAALLEQRLPQDIVLLGTSRTGEALRPRVLARELQARGVNAPRVFNLSVQYSSLEILRYLAEHFATAPGLSLAVIELSHNSLYRAALPWAEPEPGADFDARVFAWLQRHFALVAERKVFVLDSLARLLGVVLFGSRFDGTEQFGVDYVGPIFGHHADADTADFHATACTPRALAEAPAQLAQFAAERDMYKDIAESFAAHGVAVAFYVPPQQDPRSATEASPEQRALHAAVHAATGRAVWDFSDCALPADYYRDATHMSHLGGSHFSAFIAAAIANDKELARAVQ